ncbi:DUF4348 domain-containing protein [Flavobacterium sp. Fl-77]|uniref:DUF4348 domain-containing protein n=1 Tax=Flavobacterium flavipigmentatum TaxID=2893884 RepID=A0AAJ2SEN9_9FLAO|nr:MULTISPECIES: DUF4348 domain-containing protein [unclassified Flavobacterium]MDX6183019.1 DUF4348 domain-containing protein [Flavobacterium sp. Fl-33]MDX6186472.1 DUF4348 domain-containing protein [Flavobacterium sp. Fl-77]UFH37744.1 DUF4348 domain-containing protein [Flavobacterium sp. F-70]
MKNKLFIVVLLVSLFATTTILAQQNNKAEEFASFFEKFNKNKTFQMSRIHFPLTVKLNNDDFELVDYIIKKEEYTIINLNKNKEERDYNQKTILKKDKVIIQQRGVNNGIFIDYVFEKRKGLWFLKTWIDEST